MYSFSGRKVRVVHVHFDGKNLVVRLTKYLDFMEENVDDFKLLLRWIMNEPIGETTSFERYKALKIHLLHLLRGCPFRLRHESIDFASLGICKVLGR